MLRSNVVAGLAASILMTAAGAALAQTTTTTQPPRIACRSSALALCHPEAMSGDRPAVRACLIRNFEKVTPECQAAMKAAQAQMMASPGAPPPKP